MRTIYKYPVHFPRFEFITRVKLPEAFKVLKLAEQREQLMLWCDVDTGTFDQEILIGQFVTGGQLPEDIDDWHYIDTLQEMDGALILHYYWKYADD